MNDDSPRIDLGNSAGIDLFLNKINIYCQREVNLIKYHWLITDKD